MYVNGNRPTTHGRGPKYFQYCPEVERRNINSKYAKVAFFTILLSTLFTVILTLDVKNTIHAQSKCRHKKGVYYAGISVFNHFPTSIKIIANETKGFKKALTL